MKVQELSRGVINGLVYNILDSKDDLCKRLLRGFVTADIS